MSESRPDQTSTPGEPVAYGLQMKRRNPWLVWALAVVTVTIYYFVWWYKIHNEMSLYDPRQRIAPMTSFTAVSFGILLLFPPYVSTAAAGGRISRIQRSAGLKGSCSGGLGLLLFIIPLGLFMVYYQHQLNRVIDQYEASAGDRVPLYV